MYRSDYNVFNLFSQFIRKIGFQYFKLEIELEQIKEKAKAKSDCILYLRKQKRLWYKKMIYIVSKSLFDMEELKKVETEETVRNEEFQVLIRNFANI